jgi:hypothetical protein
MMMPKQKTQVNAIAAGLVGRSFAGAHTKDSLAGRYAG